MGRNLLAKYKRLGEDHPSYRKLKEALVRGQSAGVDEAVAELEAVRKVNESPAAVATKPQGAAFIIMDIPLGNFSGSRPLRPGPTILQRAPPGNHCPQLPRKPG